MLCLIVIAIIPTTFCQYAVNSGLRPDIAFGDYNDRFDITDIMNQQQRSYKDYGLAKDDDNSEEYRRSYHKKHQGKYVINKESETRKNAKKIKRQLMKTREKHVNKLANEILLAMVPKRRFGEDFAYHDKMEERDDNGNNFDENLKKFQLNNDRILNVDDLRRMENYVNKLHSPRNTRRVSDPQKELLFHHGFPIDMTVNGYLQMPLQ